MNDLPDAHARADDAEREVRRLEEENARLKAEVESLKEDETCLQSAIDATNYPEILEEIARIPTTRPEDRAFLEEAAILVRGLAEESAGLRALLRDLEWISPYGRCPTCLAMRDIGHDDDCRLKAAIG